MAGPLARDELSPEATEGVPSIPEDDPVIQDFMSRVRDLPPDQQRLYLAQLRAFQSEEGK